MPPAFRFKALAWKATLYSRAQIPSPQRHPFARPGRRAKLPETAGKFQASIIIAWKNRLYSNERRFDYNAGRLLGSSPKRYSDSYIERRIRTKAEIPVLAEDIVGAQGQELIRVALRYEAPAFPPNRMSRRQ